VVFDAKTEYDMVRNFKPVQAIFTKHKIKKLVPVDRLIKGKYQDNFEFLQWMKSFHDGRYNGEPYDAVGRRSGKRGAKRVKNRGGGGGGGGGLSTKKIGVRKGSVSRPLSRGGKKSPAPKTKPTPSIRARVSVDTKRTSSASRLTSMEELPGSPRGKKEYGSSREKAKQLEAQVEELEEEKAQLEKQREEDAEKHDIELKELEESLAEAQMERDQALEEVNDLKFKMEDMVSKTDLEASASSNKDLESAKAEIEEKLAKVQGDLKAENQSLMDRLEDSKMTIDSKNLEIEELKLKQEEMAEDLDKARKAETKTTLELNNTKKDADNKAKASADNLADLEAKLEAAQAKIQTLQDETAKAAEGVLALTPMVWWSVMLSPPDVKGLKILKVALHSMDEKSSGDDKHLVCTVVDDAGKIVGASCRTPPNAIRAPLYIILGDVKETDPALYIFFTIKHAKKKKKMVKMSEIAYAYMEVLPILNFYKSMDNPNVMQLYKKPADFTRDPDSQKAFGKNTMKIAFEMLEGKAN